MGIEQLAALAEIIASIAVIFSLLFVGFQVRDSNRQARSAALQNAMNSEITISSILTEHAAIWDKVVRGEPLEEGAELRTAIHLFNIMMTDTESRFHQHKQGYLQQESWEGRLSTLKISCRFPIYPHWRDSLSGKNHSQDFLQLLDRFSQ